MITVEFLYLVYYIRVINMYDLRSFSVLKNNDKCIGSVYKHTRNKIFFWEMLEQYFDYILVD